jgi:hypothetical protein
MEDGIRVHEHGKPAAGIAVEAVDARLGRPRSLIVSSLAQKAESWRRNPRDSPAPRDAVWCSSCIAKNQRRPGPAGCSSREVFWSPRSIDLRCQQAVEVVANASFIAPLLLCLRNPLTTILSLRAGRRPRRLRSLEHLQSNTF